MTGLPTWIGAALQSKLDHVSRSVLRQSAQAMSDVYRAGGSSAVVTSDLDALAYAVVRMPATYAAVHAALALVKEIIPDFEPQSILDVGAGPGTASWAGIEAWPSLQRATLIDSNARLLELARYLAAAVQQPAMTVDIVEGDAARPRGEPTHADVVMASYSLTELAPAALPDMLAALWQRADRLLVIVEPGTVAGFERISTYRDTLIACGAQIIAPCSHEGGCPLREDARWCHFAVRLARSRDHMIAKGGRVPFEDEKFCYLVAGKDFTVMQKGRRILATPKASKAGIALTLCAPDRAEQRLIGRRDKAAYKAAKRCGWGDIVDFWRALRSP